MQNPIEVILGYSELAEAEAAYLEAEAEQVSMRLKERAKQLRELALEAAGSAQLEAKLKALQWTEAQSKKCFYVRNAPPELVAVLRKMEGGVKFEFHHYTAARNEPTLFRFNRGPKK